MKFNKIQIVKMFASALVVGITSMIVYTRGDVYSIAKFKKQQENIITVLFEKRTDRSFFKIKKYFEGKYPQYSVLLEDEVSREYAGKIVSGDYYEKRYLELVDKGSKKIIDRCVLVYSSSKRNGGQTFLKFLLIGEGEKILKKSSCFIREEKNTRF